MATKIQKNSALIIGVVVVLALGVFFFKQTPVHAPTPADSTSTWRTFSDSAKGISFKYPETLGTKYISTTLDWPPKVNVQNGAFTCTEAGAETAQAGKTTLETINGRSYCVTRQSEGAAGHTYTQYAYGTELKDKLAYITFSLGFVNCGNYNEPEKSACDAERSSFNINPIVDQIAESLSF